MPIRLSGLTSGLDTDAIIKDLVSAYSGQKDNIVKKQTKLEWKMDAWKNINTKIYGFYTSSLSNMRMKSAYNIKSCSVSDSKIAKVTGSSTAVNGTQSLEVNKLSATAYLTGGKIAKSDNSKISGNTLLTDIGIDTGSKIKVNDTEIEITSGMKMDGLISKLKEAGVNANFDENNQRMFISSTKAGVEGEFSITASNIDGLNAITKLGILSLKDSNNQDTTDMKKYREIYNDASKNGTEEYEVAKALVEATVLTDFEKQEWTDKLNVAIADRNAAQEVIDKFNEQEDIIKKYDEAQTLIADFKTNEDILNNYKYTEEEVKNMKEFIAANKDSEDDELKKTAEDYQKIFDDYENARKFVLDNEPAKKKAEEFVKECEKKESDDAKSKLEIAQEYVSNNREAKETAEENLADANQRINEAKTKLNASAVASYTSDSVRITGQDAEIKLNGATFTSSTGTFSINGLSITALEKTTSPVYITTATDTKGMYDQIKGMITKYNELIKEIDKAFNAQSAKGYEPLTDEEKETMTDKQIEKWEEKIKDSLLRRDSDLGNISSALKAAMMQSFEINGKKYSLANFGIGTQGYFSADADERGCLHINGDSEDSVSSGKEDKLMAAINTDPDMVVEFFQQLSKNLYDDLTKRMASTSISSAYTIYNDKQMSSEYSKYKDQIAKWEKKVEYYEDYYTKQFTAMEKALSELNSKSSSLTGLFGGGQ